MALLLGAFVVCIANADELVFETMVRPVLGEICGECHGAQKQEGGLRVDSLAALLKGGTRGPALVPGEPEQSWLIRAIRREDQDFAMPPKRALTTRELNAFEQWVAEGAVWPPNLDSPVVEISLAERRRQHWAFQPLDSVPLPEVRDGRWPRKKMDRFVLARLESLDIEPSPPAERRMLIRRAYLDLLGLPPAYGDVEAFCQDPRPDAFERLVDDLLARPEYGERWGRHWLDVARYADAKGYVDGGEAKFPFAFSYRDYVVEAFNADLPYDVFIREQIAADRLPREEGGKSLAALGFLTVGSRFNFFPHEIIDDRIDVVTRGVLGLSVACARCHDHKYDPILAEDYYSLYGIFAHSPEQSPDRAPVIGTPGAGETTEFTKELAEASKAYEDYRHDLHRRVMSELRAWAGDYLRYIVQTTPEHRTRSQPELRTERGLVREVSAYASGAVWRWRAYLNSRLPDDPVFGLWVRLAQLPRSDWAASAIEVVAEFGAWADANQIVAGRFAETPELQDMEDVANCYGRLLEEAEQKWQARLATVPSANALVEPDWERVRRALYAADFPASITVDEAVDYCTLDESVEVRKRFANTERVFLKVWSDVAPRPMLVEERDWQEPQRVFLRGNPRRLGPAVPRAIPARLGLVEPIPITTGSGRLELAQALTDPRHPLTARVMVNRVWAWHFGQGLVASTSDWGTRSTPPSHPALLDHLALEFVKHGWSLKFLHRQILLSATWQQMSDDRPKARASDPENRWYWRQNRRHVAFEVVRDGMLAVAGELDSSQGGPPVEKAPDDVTHRRRTIYGFVDRERLVDLYRVFDFPSPDITATARPRTSVPQQTLFLLNSPFVLHQAEALYGHVSREIMANDREARSLDLVQSLFRRVYGREASGDELLRVGKHVGGTLHQEWDEPSQRRLGIQLAQALILSNEFLFLE